MILTNIPLELYYRILEYEGSVKLRNGKYIKQISKDDNRYKMLKNIVKLNVHQSLMSPTSYLKYIIFSNNCTLAVRFSNEYRYHSYTYRYIGCINLRNPDEYFWI